MLGLCARYIPFSSGTENVLTLSSVFFFRAEELCFAMADQTNPTKTPM